MLNLDKSDLPLCHIFFTCERYKPLDRLVNSIEQTQTKVSLSVPDRCLKHPLPLVILPTSKHSLL
jgi:hypothetical protein